MIITRTPFRISFAGGGSDISSFYRLHEGCVLSTTINKYMYIVSHPFALKNALQIKYSKTELAESIDQLKHPIVKKVLERLEIPRGVEIASFADVPAGTGLGSSSSFTVGLLHCLNGYKNNYVSKEYLASQACRIEIEDLQEPIGKQDQYAAAYGGLNFIRFHPNDSVTVEPIVTSSECVQQLEDNLLMFYTGDSRSASNILAKQKKNIQTQGKVVDSLKQMTSLAIELKEVLLLGKLDDFGRILHEGWKLKQSLASSITNEKITELYERGLQAGALGGKLLGAGGGGYLLFYCPSEHQATLRQAFSDLEELSFVFDRQGSSVIYYDDNR